MSNSVKALDYIASINTQLQFNMLCVALEEMTDEAVKAGLMGLMELQIVSCNKIYHWL